MATYTTIEAISRRLKGRLTTQAATAFGVGQIDADLLAQVLNQVEVYVESRISTRYALPITSARLLVILAEAIELLVICRVMPIYFANTEESQDGGYGAMCCEHGNQLLNELLSGDLDVVPGWRIWRDVL